MTSARHVVWPERPAVVVGDVERVRSDVMVCDWKMLRWGENLSVRQRRTLPFPLRENTT